MKATAMDIALVCQSSRMIERLQPHDYRTRFLEALATLIGCQESFGRELPDGRRPDVMLMDSTRNVLFFGEAKHSETPGNVTTRARLQRYLHWLSTHVMRRAGVGIFAVCFGQEEDANYWYETVSLLGSEVGIVPDIQKVERFGPGLVLVWFVFLPKESLA
jgi:hypothetical protein